RDVIDHLDATRRHATVELVDVQYPGGEVVDVGSGDRADVSGDRRDRVQFLVPGAVDGLGGELERGGGQDQKQLGGIGVQALIRPGAVGQPQQFGAEQVPRPQEGLQAALQIGGEEATV